MIDLTHLRRGNVPFKSTNVERVVPQNTSLLYLYGNVNFEYFSLRLIFFPFRDLLRIFSLAL